jgi:hypothetical protein
MFDWKTAYRGLVRVDVIARRAMPTLSLSPHKRQRNLPGKLTRN